MSLISENVFKVDFRKLPVLNLPVDHRSPKYVAWLQCLTVPIMMIYDRFKANRSANLYQMAHNGQVCYLRKVLNDAFDPVHRRIRITGGNKYERQHIYTHGEQKPKYLGKMYLRQSGDYTDTGIDFRVIIPLGFDLTSVIYQMNATIDFYKLAGKRYKIEYDE